MDIQRTITIRLESDTDLRNTLDVFQAVQNRLSPLCWNEGKPLGALTLQREHYHAVKGELSSQMTILAMRLVAGAYVSAKKGYLRRVAAEKRRQERSARKGWNVKPRVIKEPGYPHAGVCQFKNPSAMFLVGSRGRDASFLKDGSLSFWTTAGRKHIGYSIPIAFQKTFAEASEIDSVTVIERGGQLLGRVVLTLSVPEPKGVHPVGIDLNETNALVAVQSRERDGDADDNPLFVSGKAHKVRNKRSRQTRKRLQAKLSSRKAQKKDTRSLRRLLKRHGRKQSNRTRTFCQTVAKELCSWVKPDSVLVLEDLSIPQSQKGTVKGKSLRRRLSLWQFGKMLECIRNRAERDGLAVETVNPAYTSVTCNRCGLIGCRKRHQFQCPHCQHQEHADVNAARNIRDRFVAFRSPAMWAAGCNGEPSISPDETSFRREALSAVLVTVDEGKPTSSLVGN